MLKQRMPTEINQSCGLYIYIYIYVFLIFFLNMFLSLFNRDSDFREIFMVLKKNTTRMLVEDELITTTRKDLDKLRNLLRDGNVVARLPEKKSKQLDVTTSFMNTTVQKKKKTIN